MGRQLQAKQLIRARPCALAMAKGTAIPIEALEIQHLLADVTMPSLMHPHDTVEALHRTTGPHHPSQNLIDTLIDRLPLGTQTLTHHLFHHHQLRQAGTLVVVRGLHGIPQEPQAR